MAKKTDTLQEDKLRIAIVYADKCKPKKCTQECKRFCPVVRTGKLCVEATPTCKSSVISEILCIGCGICVKKCPFNAISIINIPSSLSSQVSHRFGPNSFKLHRLPLPRNGHILGLIGTNGIGKSTALSVLSGKLKPNLGNYSDPPSWKDILKHYRGSDLQNYFSSISEEKLRCAVKPQYVDVLAKRSKKIVKELIYGKETTLNETKQKLMVDLELEHLLDRNVSDLSGGELQRFALYMTASQNVDVYMFDESSSYLDIKQRVAAAKLIRDLVKPSNYIICVEHDLAICDYLSDIVCCLWGSPSVYGVVTTPYSVKEGINNYLEGFIPTENLRFREESISFKINQDLDADVKRDNTYYYPDMEKKLKNFTLHIVSGSFSTSQITVLLGQNGTGKTTFIRILSGLLSPDNNAKLEKLLVSYKPQMINAKFEGSVNDLLHTKIREAYIHPQFITDVVKPMGIENIKDLQVQTLSGGELQRVAIVLALGKPADIYLLDEPSAYLDCGQRIEAARVIKRFIMHGRKTAFIVEHDFIMATYLADQVIVYEGNPGVDCIANSPQPLVQGMNKFLKSLDITFRRDAVNYRPRINKHDSIKDKEQKASASKIKQHSKYNYMLI